MWIFLGQFWVVGCCISIILGSGYPLLPLRALRHSLLSGSPWPVGILYRCLPVSYNAFAINNKEPGTGGSKNRFSIPDANGLAMAAGKCCCPAGKAAAGAAVRNPKDEQQKLN